jgi:hypothetical protein
MRKEVARILRHENHPTWDRGSAGCDPKVLTNYLDPSPLHTEPDGGSAQHPNGFAPALSKPLLTTCVVTDMPARAAELCFAGQSVLSCSR